MKQIVEKKMRPIKKEKDHVKKKKKKKERKRKV